MYISFEESKVLGLQLAAGHMNLLMAKSIVLLQKLQKEQRRQKKAEDKALMCYTTDSEETTIWAFSELSEVKF